jgi:hypothetical protein
MGIPGRDAKLASCTRRLVKNGSLVTKSASGRRSAKVAKAASISRLVLALRTVVCSPIARAAGSMSRSVVSASGPVGLTSTAIRATAGTSSRRSSNRFAVSSPLTMLTPVRLLPGRARLVTRPVRTGSSATINTMGMLVVAAFAGRAAGLFAAITATRRRTNSAANSGSRSYLSSAQRYTIATFSPSTKPVSFRPRWNARRRSANTSGDALLRNPTTGIAGCCARAASGHAAAPPSSVMKSRRFTAQYSRASDGNDSTPQLRQETVRCGISLRAMSVVGQTEKSRQRDGMAGLPSTADMFDECRDGR